MHPGSFVRRIAIGAGLAAIVSAWLAIGPVPQDPSYHVFVARAEPVTRRTAVARLADMKAIARGRS